jgi:glycerol-3-phosphate dehydrogenase (NAD(P)+)
VSGGNGARAETVGIAGAGRFGTALANLLAARGRSVLLWSKNPEIPIAIERTRRNPRLPDIEVAPSVRVTTDPAVLARTARLIVLATASTDVRDRVRILGDVVDGSHIVVSAIGSLASPGESRVSEVVLESTPALRVGALAGPAMPPDLVAGNFCSMVVASHFEEVAAEVRRLLNAPPVLRVYASNDLIGVELAAALSGAYTVAVGMADALGTGPGPRAVLITRALAEAQRLGVAAGAHARTFTGLAGLGNLLVRSSSTSSRDYLLGQALGRGEPPPSWHCEGARAAVAGVALADRFGVRMPVLSALAAAIDGKISPRQAAAAVADNVAREE